MQPEIQVHHLTKDYGHGRGIYDVSFTVAKGETLGFLGPNGAGKSTTMRHLMGFSKPQSGNASISQLDCFTEHANIMERVGYLPGEVALPEGVSGKEFLDIMRGMRGIKKTKDRTEELIQIFRVENLKSPVKRMSVGEKRKLAIVAAFMADPDVLLLDEPTSGLDPVMQEIFIGFILEEKKRRKTILLSSHIFSEVEALCDRIAIIKEGKIVSVVSAAEVKHYKRKTFEITFASANDYAKFLTENLDVRASDIQSNKIEVAAENAQCDALIKTLVNYDVKKFVEHQQTLEKYFMQFYKSDKTFGGIDNAKRH